MLERLNLNACVTNAFKSQISSIIASEFIFLSELLVRFKISFLTFTY
jgi:hypothetical protein